MPGSLRSCGNDAQLDRRRYAAHRADALSAGRPPAPSTGYPRSAISSAKRCSGSSSVSPISSRNLAIR